MPTNQLLNALAWAQGRTLAQLDLALLDVQAGQYERLKEFGIRARKDGDQVHLSFRDQPLVVANTPEAVHAGIVTLCVQFFSSSKGLNEQATGITHRLEQLETNSPEFAQGAAQLRHVHAALGEVRQGLAAAAGSFGFTL